MLVQLAELYPALFGDAPLPLKRGIFQDLQDAHPGLFTKDDLKAALALHTRATRYLQAVASGQARHDLAGQVVEAMAPEHVHHALIEVFRRRQQRTDEDLRPQLRRRLLVAIEASGLSREDYAQRMSGRDDALNTLLDEVLAEAAARAAKDEAQWRAFEASGQTVAAFADMYGLNPREVSQALARVQARRAAATTAAATTTAPTTTAAPTVSEATAPEA